MISKMIHKETIFVLVSQSKIAHTSTVCANTIESLQTNSKLISFSTLPLVNVKEDDVRYPSDYWKINGK
jgi:hypothetical protein